MCVYWYLCPLNKIPCIFQNVSRDTRDFLKPEVTRGLIALIVDCRLRSEPWSIVLEKVYIVVGPQSFKDYDPFKEEQLELEVKLSALDGIESEWRALNENGGGGNGGASRSAGH